MIGYDGLSIVTYPGGPTELTKAQLKKIFTGQIKNWREINTQDLPVQIVVVASIPSTLETFSQIVLDGDKINLVGSKTLSSLEEVGKYVGSTPGAIAFVSGRVTVEGANHPKHPAFNREVIAITLGEPSANARKAITEFSKLLTH